MADPARTKRLRYLIEGLGALVAYGFFRAMPLRAASAVGGFLARTVGPRTGTTKRARVNLRRAMPELSEAGIERIVRGMWDNLGRVIAEYPHLGELQVYDPHGYVETVGTIRRLKDTPPAAHERYIFWSGHYGNWEICMRAITQAGLTATAIYRAANNPYVDRLILRARGAGAGRLIPKGAAGRRAVAALHRGSHLCVLIDQKMNNGIAVPFFGREAMTEIVLARLALRYNCRVVPVRVERLAGVKFRLTFEAPMDVPRTGDDAADALALMTRINARLEEWVRERPDHWLWLHRRWPD
ncbi:MAG TPA: lauroyl acyltransferase [Stellaceae bacterium]|jgi:KDO2-lipid IV(A) lauroyltransferase|nr:lauroyl acyltransferase [Stellaceae bacterium]